VFREIFIMMKRIWLWALLVLVMALAVGIYSKLPDLTVQVPAAPPALPVVHVSQGWSEAQRQQFYHTAQGTRLLPYDWFMALEQPCFSFSACSPFADSAYLSRFGFLPGQKDPELNPGGLPIGFAREPNFYDPHTRTNYPALGLSCSACHTGQLELDNVAVRIDGAPAMIEVSQFQKALGLSLLFTDKFPFRFARFAEKVLGPNPDAAKVAELKKSFEGFLSVAMAEKAIADKRKLYVNQAGFARTDALTRIGNMVFAVDTKIEDNFAVSSAPVRYPQIWDASWFTWVQYNSSIADPMVRNIGEALGVRAQARLYGDGAKEFDHSVNIEGLAKIEHLLSGDAPYTGLQSPKWPSQFPPLDPQKVAQGEALYRQHCQGCHLPPESELKADLQSPEPRYWWKNRLGKLFLKVVDVKVEDIGTDPRQAIDFMQRTADTGALGQGRVSAAAGLELVTKTIAVNYFEKNKFSPEKRNEWSGFHDPADPYVRAEAIYKARPLNGIWAVAPYLHNGSVPSLYQLLSPASERTAQFWLGSKRFDPKDVGYSVTQFEGASLYDTAKPGNSNQGHEFKDGPRGKGVIGPALSVEQRRALIEYLKSI
jgi:hypothetical protein